MFLAAKWQLALLTSLIRASYRYRYGYDLGLGLGLGSVRLPSCV